MGNSRQFLKTTSNWKVFFYELHIYQRALSPEDLRSWIKIANFPVFPDQIEILLTYFSFQCGQKAALTDMFKLQIKPTFWKISIIYIHDFFNLVFLLYKRQK